jgi:hypothetical protein
VSAPELQLRPGGGRSNGVRPSLSSASDTCGAVVLPAGVGAPRNFVAPHTCGELSCQAGRCISIARLLCPDLELHQGLTFHFDVLLPCCMR